MYDTKLNNAQRERLVLLAEECSEVIKACMKILRHGYGDSSTYDNRGALEFEMGHVDYAYQLMLYHEDIDEDNVQQSMKVKEAEIAQYLHFQK